MKLSKEELMKRHDILCEKYILIKDFVSNLGVPENYREDFRGSIYQYTQTKRYGQTQRMVISDFVSQNDSVWQSPQSSF